MNRIKNIAKKAFFVLANLQNNFRLKLHFQTVDQHKNTFDFI